jgi:histidinol-phosphate aminotransferase
MAAGVAAIKDNDYYMDNCKRIIESREWTAKRLLELGFTVTESSANFLFAKSGRISGEKLYLELKKRGILVRHFSGERIKEYNRITIGTREEMEAFIGEVETILKETLK